MVLSGSNSDLNLAIATCQRKCKATFIACIYLLMVTVQYSKRVSNGPPTATEIQRVHDFIAAQERDINFVTDALLKEQDRLSVSEKAVSNLKLATEQVKAVIKSHQKNIGSLKGVKEQFQMLQWKKSPEIQNEPHTRELYEALANNITQILTKTSPVIEDQIAEAESNVILLSKRLNQLEDELVGWIFSHDLTKDRVRQLKASIELLKPGLDSAKRALSPIYRIHREIWVLIFEAYIMIELEEYLAQLNTLPFRSFAFVLSSVCTTWRNIVITQPGLWSTITIHPSSLLSSSEYALLCHSINKTSQRFTFICNLSQTLEWSNEIMWLDAHDDGLDREYREGEIDNNATIPPEKSFITHLLINHDYYSYAERVWTVPFRNTENLKLTFLSDGDEGNIQTILEPFTSLKSFELHDKGSRIQNLGNGIASLSSITHLGITITDMPDFDMTNIFDPRLVELRVRHNGRNPSRQLRGTLRLPKLKTLGITHQDTALLESVDTPGLRDLELYGSISHRSEWTLGPRSRDALSKIINISFYDWRAESTGNAQSSPPAPNLGCPGAAFRELAVSTSSLRTAKFVGCQVNGVPLLELFRSRQTSNNPLLSHLQSMEFRGCSTITRSEYEAITELFPNVRFCEFTFS
jgi:hypothetical protein